MPVGGDRAGDVVDDNGGGRPAVVHGRQAVVTLLRAAIAEKGGRCVSSADSASIGASETASRIFIAPGNTREQQT